MIKLTVVGDEVGKVGSRQVWRESDWETTVFVPVLSTGALDALCYVMQFSSFSNHVWAAYHIPGLC